MPSLEDMIVKPNTVGPNGEPLFRPASSNPPLPPESIAWMQRLMAEQEDDENLEVPCGCG